MGGLPSYSVSASSSAAARGASDGMSDGVFGSDFIINAGGSSAGANIVPVAVIVAAALVIWLVLKR